jgi:hypothetical protein
MPHTRHPFEYPINRLFIHVGMALQTWITRLPRAYTPEERAATEALIEERLSLPKAVELQLLKSYHFRWGSNGRVRTIKLVPDPKHRRCPGIAQLKDLFFR